MSDKLGFVRQKRSLCEAGRSPESNAFLTDTMDNNQKLTDKTEKKPRTPSYKYSSRLNEEQHIRFNELLCKAGSEHNRSRFIVKRIFGEEFVVTRRDPSKVQFVARLNDFYFQFQKLANNYNQVVKAINSHFSNVAIPHQVRTIGAADERIKSP
ncbi:mobilization protein [Alistipes shahii]|uniref:plasmid mobilization protein n=1 Tax=Alistipes shahii TaxID=328814 RepID=UPI00266C9EED|nr:mobilization protein [Alistipes shahii]